MKDSKYLTNLAETIVAEIPLRRRTVFFILSYRTFRQTEAECNNYFRDLQAL